MYIIFLSISIWNGFLTDRLHSSKDQFDTQYNTPNTGKWYHITEDAAEGMTDTRKGYGIKVLEIFLIPELESKYNEQSIIIEFLMSLFLIRIFYLSIMLYAHKWVKLHKNYMGMGRNNCEIHHIKLNIDRYSVHHPLWCLLPNTTKYTC